MLAEIPPQFLQADFLTDSSKSAGRVTESMNLLSEIHPVFWLAD